MLTLALLSLSSGSLLLHDPIQDVADFSGNYAASQAAFAMRGGQSSVSMRNAKGVTIVVLQNGGKESGTRFSRGPSGVSLKLSKERAHLVKRNAL
jgi:hypothetical protein